MAEDKHVEAVMQGAKSLRQFREHTQGESGGWSLLDLTHADLRKARDLRGALLTNADMRWADLRGLNIEEAAFYNADLRYCNAEGANLTGGRLNGANLSYAHFNNANLSKIIIDGGSLHEGMTCIETDFRETLFVGADLRFADFREAVFEKANMAGALLGQTIFGHSILRSVQGLEAVQHWAPSIIDFDTLRLSGEMPLVFYQGCGLSDELIQYLPSLLNTPIQFHSCFISYASNDQAFAERLHADLQSKGVRVWFAPRNLKIGDKFRSEIDKAILVYDKLLIVLSEHSINSSWVEKEVETAFEK